VRNRGEPGRFPPCQFEGRSGRFQAADGEVVAKRKAYVERLE